MTRMMRDFSTDHRWLSINTATVRKQHGRDWPLLDILDACARHGIRAVSPWRDQVAAAGLAATASTLRAHGLELSGYCRGGMFTEPNAKDENLRALDEACELGAPCLVLVVGSLPGALAGKPQHKDIASARAMVRDGIATLLQEARKRNMPLAIEPLHPTYAADRACINTLEQALDICDLLGEGIGVAIDVYHVWWDPKLDEQIARAGAGGKILAHHICDWLVPTKDLLLDRGMMGDGVIDLKRIRSTIETAGYSGPQEVEIFSSANWWKKPGEEVLSTCVDRFHTVC
jgi:sugar phosphate isomerase/epimerase